MHLNVFLALNHLMKLFKKIALWVVAIVILVVIQGFVLIYIYEDEIKQSAIEKLNTQLNTPIKVGKIELSYFKHFPFVSLKFPDVIIYDSKPDHSGVLLSASEVSLLFNIWDIYKGNYKVKKLYVENGTWTSSIDKRGVNNFDILKPDTSSLQKSSTFELTIEEIILINSSIKHVDLQNYYIINVLFNDLKAKGDFNADDFKLKLVSNAQILNLNIDKISYIRNKKINLNTSVFVDFKNSVYAFDKTEILIEKMRLLLDGKIQNSTNSKNIKLKIAGNNLNIQSFVSILPLSYANYFKEYTSTGEFYFNTIIDGSLMPDKSPSINVTAGLNNVNIIVNNDRIKNQEIKNIKFKFEYKNNSTEVFTDDVLTIKEFYGLYNNNAIKGNVKINNLDDPYLDLAIETKQSLVEIQKIWKVNDIDFKAGELYLDIKLKAKYSDLRKDNNIKDISSEGVIKIHNTKLIPGKYGLSIDDINGDYKFLKSDLRINQMTFSIGKSDFKINGFFRNLFSFILVENEDLEIDASLVSKNIDLKELLGSGATSTDDEPYKLKVNKRINANVKLQIKQLDFLPFQAFDMEGGMKIENQIISTDYLAFRSQKGLVFAKIDFNTHKNNNMPMNIDLNLNKVDASNLFREFNNFGVDIITDKNIRGQISSNMKINMVWDENLNSKLEDFYAKGNVLIENGQLLDFEPMLALGKYIDVNELKNLRFSNLENTIEIKNKSISIPDMEIKSNALSMRLSGSHTFENKIDYHLQLLLSDFIKKKSKKLGDERFGEIEQDGTGNTKLFIRMYGDAYNPSFSLDKKMIRKKLADDFKKERVEVKKILKDEFGSWFKKEKEFKESISEQSEEWEKDIPQPTLQNKSVSSTNITDSASKKTKLQKLKEKLKEKPDPENE